MTARFIIGDTRQVVAAIPDGTIDLIVTSPPFLALRSYLPADHPDKALEIGQEANPAAFIQMLLELTAEWGRVLAPHGSIAVELGDTYSGNIPPSGKGAKYNPGGDLSGTGAVKVRSGPGWPLAKSLALIPELYRIGLAYGINPLTGAESPAGRWRVRNVVRWCRPNPPVGALGDKYRPSTSDMVIACRSPKRWFDLDAVRTPYKYPDQVRAPLSEFRNPEDGTSRRHVLGEFRAEDGAGAPPLDHWIIPTAPYKGAHYATFPAALVTTPIDSMCPRQVCTVCGEPRRRIVGEAEYVGKDGTVRDDMGGKSWHDHSNDERAGRTQAATGRDLSVVRVAPTLDWTDCGHNAWRAGVVLDPFGGSGTVGQVATGMGRDAILIDLDERNAHLAQDRIGMFCTVERHQQVTA